MALYEFDPEDARRFVKEQGIRARQRGDELQLMHCPYCKNKTDDKNTFAINLRTGQFKCLRASCGAHGNMITLARDFGFSLGTNVDEYYTRRKRYRDLTRYPKPEVRTPAVEYMESRGISKAVTESYGITTQKEHDNVITFPFYDEVGKLQFVKYRKADFDKTKDKNKEWCEANCKPILFGMDHCDATASDTLVMTEGQIDSLSLTEAGIKNAVSVPTGAKGFTWVPYCWDFLGQFKTLIVFGDHENDHITLLDEMSSRFHGTVKHVRPEDYKGHKDANEILLAEGVDAIRAAVAGAVPVENPLIKPLASVTRKDWTDVTHFESGLESLDKMIGGLYLGQLVILTGKRGLGKSTLASQIGLHAIKADLPTFFYSGELNDWQFQSWFERQAAGRQHIRAEKTGTGFVRYTVDKHYEHDIVQWYDGMAYIYDNKLLLSDDNDNTEEEALIDTLKTAIRQYGCKVLFIDNLMTAMTDDMTGDLYRQQSEFVKKLAVIAKAYEVLVILIAHPRKSQAGSSFDNDDIAGSANITNLADLVLDYRKPTQKEAATPGIVRKLAVTKNRINGRTDSILLYFDEQAKRIAETESGLDFAIGWEDKKGFEGVEQNDELPF